MDFSPSEKLTGISIYGNVVDLRRRSSANFVSGQCTHMTGGSSRDHRQILTSDGRAWSKDL